MREFPAAHDAIWNEVHETTWTTFSQIKTNLNNEFGQDFCKKHPEVLASLVQAQMTAYGNALIAAAIQAHK
jgi:hypothetical protein